MTRAATLPLLVCAALGSGCAIGMGKSLHEYSLLDVENHVPAPARPISSEQSDKVILGFTFDTDYVDHAYRDLLAACPRGEILNVHARYSTDLGFFAYRSKIRIDAICAEGPAPAPRPIAER